MCIHQTFPLKPSFRLTQPKKEKKAWLVCVPQRTYERIERKFESQNQSVFGKQVVTDQMFDLAEQSG